MEQATKAHTPGPWVVDDEQEDAHRIYVRHQDSGRICQCFANCLVTTDAELAANASLIAAAPELLEACRAIVAWDEAEKSAKPYADDNGKAYWQRIAMCADAFDKARAAIAKATA